jgi:hypothetical protein
MALGAPVEDEDNGSKNRRSRAAGAATRINSQLNSGAKLPRASAHRKGRGQRSASEPVLVGEGTDAGRWPTLCEARPLHSLRRGRLGPMDEISSATVDQRAVAKVDAVLAQAREKSRAKSSAEVRKASRGGPTIRLAATFPEDRHG